MITKGTQEYKAAQAIANKLTDASMTERATRFSWIDAVETIAAFCEDIMKTTGFAAQVATTVAATCGKGYTAARISDKQSWILACAAVENNISFI